jgi:hypothetical protein
MLKGILIHLYMKINITAGKLRLGGGKEVGGRIEEWGWGNGIICQENFPQGLGRLKERDDKSCQNKRGEISGKTGVREKHLIGLKGG